MRKITLSLLEGEIAVAIEGYEWYLVTSLGRVFSKWRGGRFLKGSPNNKGYLGVDLYNEHSKKKFTIHKLVANSFKIPGWDDPNLEVDHINNDNRDNRLVNLQMLTPEQNKAKIDRKKQQLAKINSKFECNRARPCVCIETGEFFWSATEAGRSLGKGNGAISMCCCGLRQTAYNLHWRYATEEEIALHTNNNK